MNPTMSSTPHVEPFFFDSEPGTRFSLYHAPNAQVAARGAILYVHPFAEELNKSRRMASLQARAFAAMGFAVLQIDLFGCGDSCGDFSAARWELWKRDLGVAHEWLAKRNGGPVHLWGLRLGGLLALDYASGTRVAGIILWQPYLSGRTCINQFLRLRMAAYMLDEDPAMEQPAASGNAALRAELTARGTIEVAGYEVAAELVRAIDAVDAANLKLPPCTVHWFACGAPVNEKLAAAAQRLAACWAADGVALHYHPVAGAPFWSTAEIAECPALLAATCAVFAQESK
ncbi:MAG: hydrolase 2, exosortase A system-associated [Pseudomonadota bacterium]